MHMHVVNVNCYTENEDSLHKLAVKSTLTNVTGMFGSGILEIFGQGLILKCYILCVSTIFIS